MANYMGTGKATNNRIIEHVYNREYSRVSLALYPNLGGFVKSTVDATDLLY